MTDDTHNLVHGSSVTSTCAATTWKSDLSPWSSICLLTFSSDMDFCGSSADKSQSLTTSNSSWVSGSRAIANVPSGKKFSSESRYSRKNFVWHDLYQNNTRKTKHQEFYRNTIMTEKYYVEPSDMISSSILQIIGQLWMFNAYAR